MRIGIDARELCGRSTGVGRYLGGLLAQWSTGDRARQHEFVLYAPSDIVVPLDSRRFATRTVRGSGGAWWEQAQVPSAAARDHLDVWFSPGYSVPLRLKVPAVVAIHDISFVAHPEWFRMREGMRLRWLARQSASRARAVITISQFSRRELVERLGVADAKIHVIPPGISTHPAPGTLAPAPSTLAPAPSTQHPAPGTPTVLFVGSIFNRRHVPDLIRAFAPIARARADAALEIVGDNRSHPFEDLPAVIAAESVERQVRWHRYVSDDRLNALYTEARAFAFLSEYEGLGLTPLEALAAGVPPVLLDTDVARESCGAAALYVRARDLRATTKALDALLFSETTRAQVLAAAPGVLAAFSWPRAAADTLALLERSA